MKKLSIVGILSLLAFGCGDDDDRDTRPMLMDSGTIMLPDSSTTEMDSGTTTPEECREPITDLRVVNMDPMVMGQLLPRCSADTLMCLQGCGEDGPCQEACIAADTTPGVNVGGSSLFVCDNCLNYQFVSCLSNEGCGTQVGDYFCCLEANGCSGDAPCPACEAATMALSACVPTASSRCAPYQQACFGS